MPPASWIPPLASLQSLLRVGMSALPVVRYAAGIVGLAAAAALVSHTATEPPMAVLGVVAMTGGMVLLILVARLSTHRDRQLGESLTWPALVLAWVVVVATTVVIALMITITFWGEPSSWRSVLDAAHRTALGRADQSTCGRKTDG